MECARQLCGRLILSLRIQLSEKDLNGSQRSIAKRITSMVEFTPSAKVPSTSWLIQSCHLLKVESFLHRESVMSTLASAAPTILLSLVLNHMLQKDFQRSQQIPKTINLSMTSIKRLQLIQTQDQSGDPSNCQIFISISNIRLELPLNATSQFAAEITDQVLLKLGNQHLFALLVNGEISNAISQLILLNPCLNSSAPTKTL